MEVQVPDDLHIRFVRVCERDVLEFDLSRCDLELCCIRNLLQYRLSVKKLEYPLCAGELVRELVQCRGDGLHRFPEEGDVGCECNQLSYGGLPELQPSDGKEVEDEITDSHGPEDDEVQKVGTTNGLVPGLLNILHDPVGLFNGLLFSSESLDDLDSRVGFVGVGVHVRVLVSERHPVLEASDGDEIDAQNQKRKQNDGRKAQGRAGFHHDYQNREHQGHVGDHRGDQFGEHLLEGRDVTNEPAEDLSRWAGVEVEQRQCLEMVKGLASDVVDNPVGDIGKDPLVSQCEKPADQDKAGACDHGLYQGRCITVGDVNIHGVLADHG